MLRLEMLPAEHGDCLLLEYGPGKSRRHRILFDGGPETAYREIRERLLQLPLSKAKKQRVIDLLVVTHIDADHIEGVIKLLQDDEVALHPKDVWFNDWNHLAGLESGTTIPERLGPEQGEFLGAMLLEQDRKWNAAFKGRTVMVPPDPEQPLLAWSGPGGLKLTVLSPTLDTLLDLKRTWKKAIEAAGFTPGDKEKALEQFAARRWAKDPDRVRLGDETKRKTLDHSQANGSSIAVLAEYRGRRLLLTGDAFADVLRQNIERLAAERDEAGTPFAVDAWKLSHHGSTKNMTPQLMAALTTPVYCVSTNGKRFKHPDREALAILAEHHTGDAQPVVAFNYLSPFTAPWEDSDDVTARYEDDAVVTLATD